MRLSERQMQLRLPNELFDQLTEVARLTANSRSSVVRRLLSTGLAQELKNK